MKTPEEDLVGLAYKVALEWADRQDVFERDELVSICWLAGNTALPRWDRTRGALSTFVVPRMRGAVLDALRTQTRAGSRRTPRHLLDLDTLPLPPSTPDHGDASCLACDLAAFLDTLDPAHRALAEGILTYGTRNGAEALVYVGPVAERWTLKTFQVRRAVVTTGLRAVVTG